VQIFADDVVTRAVTLASLSESSAYIAGSKSVFRSRLLAELEFFPAPKYQFP
jgi:hypothetical protein